MIWNQAAQSGNLRSRLWVVFACLTIGAAPSTFGRTAFATPRTTVTDVARELVCNCPDCGHQAVDQCGHCAYAEKYRAAIALQLRAGKSKDEILNNFANTYGEQILGNPRPRGFNRFAMSIPAVVALCALVPLGLVLRHRRSRGLLAGNEVPAAPAAGPEDPRVAAALRDLDY